MTNTKAIKVLSELLTEERTQDEVQALAKAIGALCAQDNITVSSSSVWTTWTPPTVVPCVTTSTDPCGTCSNNPKNGGSGNCNCTIPYMNKVTC